MPKSVQFTQEVGSLSQFASAISATSNLEELLDLVPAPYRPRMRDLVHDTYRAAIKSNNTHTYLATLEKHELDGTFPPEIGGRLAAPALQISKEFLATAECKSAQASIDKSIRDVKTGLLQAAIDLKKRELGHLQSLFAETKYKTEADTIMTEVAEHLFNDAGISARNPDGSLALTNCPSWIRDDYDWMNKYRLLFPARAVALAFMQVFSEMSRRMGGLSLKKRTDDDIDMMDASHTDNVATIVQRELAKLLKENKLQNVGNNGKGKKKKTSTSKNPARDGSVGFRVSKYKGGKGNPPGGKGKGKKSNKKGKGKKSNKK